MAKKSNSSERKPFNFGDSPLVKQTEQTVIEGYEAIERKEQQGGGGASPAAENADGGAATILQPVEQQAEPLLSSSSNSDGGSTVRRFHKEPTRDILVHCPASLHTRLSNYKLKLWDDLGERKTINNMVVEAIADWLDKIGA